MQGSSAAQSLDTQQGKCQSIGHTTCQTICQTNRNMRCGCAHAAPFCWGKHQSQPSNRLINHKVLEISDTVHCQVLCRVQLLPAPGTTTLADTCKRCSQGTALTCLDEVLACCHSNDADWNDAVASCATPREAQLSRQPSKADLNRGRVSETDPRAKRNQILQTTPTQTHTNLYAPLKQCMRNTCTDETIS